MKSRVLMVNFTEDEVNKMKDLPLTFDRGYLADVEEKQNFSKQDDEDEYLYYFPHNIFEYQVIVIRFSEIEGLRAEFSSKVEEYDVLQKRQQFHKFMNGGGKVIYISGDYIISSLLDFGVVGTSMVVQSDRDINVECRLDKETPLGQVFHKIKSDVVLPAKKYISISDAPYEYGKIYYDDTTPVIYRNKEGKILGYYHNKNAKYSSGTNNPQYFVLPELKNTTSNLKDILRALGQTFPKLLPDLYVPDWKEDENLLPVSIGEYDEKINAVRDKAIKEIEALEKEKDVAKNGYKSLVNILTTTGDDLVGAVTNVLETYFKIPVENVDENSDSPVKKEDLLLKYNGRVILTEVKGDKSKYPRQQHVTQVWKHLSRSKDITEGALILNYDWDTKPGERAEAYTGEDESAIEDIIYIDTRELHKLAHAIIKGNMKPKDATEVLLTQGRVKFPKKKK